jgi:hypothetical protein
MRKLSAVAAEGWIKIHLLEWDCHTTAWFEPIPSSASLLSFFLSFSAAAAASLPPSSLAITQLPPSSTTIVIAPFDGSSSSSSTLAAYADWVAGSMQLRLLEWHLANFSFETNGDEAARRERGERNNNPRHLKGIARVSWHWWKWCSSKQLTNFLPHLLISQATRWLKESNFDLIPKSFYPPFNWCSEHTQIERKWKGEFFLPRWSSSFNRCSFGPDCNLAALIKGLRNVR